MTLLAPVPALGLTETGRGFVNTWECDENAHWNVQFYARAFEQAAWVFALRAAGASPGARAAICRHVRHYRELRVSEGLRIESGRLVEGPHAGSVVHLMRATADDSLVATALDQPGYRLPDLARVTLEAAEPALPRGIPGEPQGPVDTARLLAEGRAGLTHQGLVMPHEIGPDGELTAHGIASRMTDLAVHAWDLAGITGDWLTANGCGRVAVETRFTRLGRAGAGEALAGVSLVEAVEGRTLLLRHQFERLADGVPVVAAQIRCLVMDLASRRAVPLPAGLTAAGPLTV